MAYGTLKVDTVTFTDGGVDKSVSISGLVQNPTFSGNITVTGTVSGNTIQGQTVSGATVTGATALFSTGTFISLTGTTSQGTTATYTSGSFTSLTGVTTSGTTANFVSGVFNTQISGETVTGNTGAFTTLTGGVTTITSGVFAAGSDDNPSISFTSDPDTGLYSPGADQLALSTNGTGRLFVNASGLVSIGTSSPGSLLSLYAGASAEYFRGGGNGVTTRDLVLSASTGTNAGDTHTLNASGSTGRLILSTASSPRMTVDSAGRVGIGTTSPGYPLEVAANTGIIAFDVDGINGNKIRYGGAGANANVLRFLEYTGTERARITSSGQLLVGTSSAESATIGGLVQIQATGSSAALLIKRNSANAIAPYIYLAKSRGANNATTIVASGDSLGELRFAGADGSSEVGSLAALIKAEVDGTPGTDDMPGRLVFSTTADGASSPTERFRITNDGVQAYNQAAPLSFAAAATLTAADQKNGIIRYTGGAATLTLPSGADLEASIPGIYSGMTFEWSVINTGSGTCTLGALTGQSITGSTTISAGASGRFATRRASANTFISYRLS